MSVPDYPTKQNPSGVNGHMAWVKRTRLGSISSLILKTNFVCKLKYNQAVDDDPNYKKTELVPIVPRIYVRHKTWLNGSEYQKGFVAFINGSGGQWLLMAGYCSLTVWIIFQNIDQVIFMLSYLDLSFHLLFIKSPNPLLVCFFQNVSVYRIPEQRLF